MEAGRGVVEAAGGVVEGARGAQPPVVKVPVLHAVRTCQCMAETALPLRMAVVLLPAELPVVARRTAAECILPRHRVLNPASPRAEESRRPAGRMTSTADGTVNGGFIEMPSRPGHTFSDAGGESGAHKRLLASNSFNLR